jgi:hypothetical protein
MQWLDVLQRLHIARIDTMKLLTDLFTTDYGLMSVAGIAFMLGMAVWFRMFFKRKMDEDAKNAGV